MTVNTLKRQIASLAVAALGTCVVWADVPSGWIVAGSAPADYEFSRDETTSASGRHSARIVAKPGAGSNGFGTLMQTIDAESYRGGRWRLSAKLKTSGTARAQMWMRVDGPERKVLAFDNMDSRPITGTTDWKRYEIVLDVPSESLDIAFGFFLAQEGTVWADDFKLEKVAASVPVTSTIGRMPKAPANADFESF